MRADKRKNLEAKGWKVGGAKDFLGLTDGEAAYIELRLKLAQGLKAKRSQQGLSQTEHLGRRIASWVRSSAAVGRPSSTRINGRLPSLRLSPYPTRTAAS